MRNRDKQANDLEAYNKLLIDYNRLLDTLYELQDINYKLKGHLTKLENRNWFERLFNIDM